MTPLDDATLASLEALATCDASSVIVERSQLFALIAELRRLRTEVEALREDKARLDWLLDNDPNIPSDRAAIDISRAADREEK